MSPSDLREEKPGIHPSYHVCDSPSKIKISKFLEAYRYRNTVGKLTTFTTESQTEAP